MLKVFRFFSQRTETITSDVNMAMVINVMLFTLCIDATLSQYGGYRSAPAPAPSAVYSGNVQPQPTPSPAYSTTRRPPTTSK